VEEEEEEEGEAGVVSSVAHQCCHPVRRPTMQAGAKRQGCRLACRRLDRITGKMSFGLNDLGLLNHSTSFALPGGGANLVVDIIPTAPLAR